jgi:hypothetical protein
MNTFFGCSHRRTTFPMTPTRKNGGFPAGVLVHSETYVVCLDCGKELPYDWDEMRVAKRTSNRRRAAEAQLSLR